MMFLDRLRALRRAWQCYREELAILRAADATIRRLETLKSAQDRQQQRIRRMTNAELISCSTQWGGGVVWPEMRRRGLSVPQPPDRG